MADDKMTCGAKMADGKMTDDKMTGDASQGSEGIPQKEKEPISNNLQRQIRMGKVFTKKRQEKMTDDKMTGDAKMADDKMTDGKMTDGKMTDGKKGKMTDEDQLTKAPRWRQAVGASRVNKKHRSKSGPRAASIGSIRILLSNCLECMCVCLRLLICLKSLSCGVLQSNNL